MKITDFKTHLKLMEAVKNFDGDGQAKGKITNNSTSESQTSMEIKILAEVEKIWINYDLNENGSLEFDEVQLYLKNRCPHIPEANMKSVFDSIDTNLNNSIDRDEMYVFIKQLMS